MSDINYWIVVVDDDVANLMMAGNVMSKHGMRVTALKSGKALLEYIETKEVPDLCLLDIKMPGMNGFETLTALRSSKKGRDLPVVFLTADESQEAETTGLSLGAMDFIKKPFVPEVLVLRAKHIIDLIRLQRDLAYEVEVKTEETNRLFLQVVSALAAALDVKSTGTGGHSERVAKCAREIAERFGWSGRKQDDIYLAGLLHDIGKIGVPDEILKKSGSLTDQELASLKEHPAIGARILATVKEKPSLALGAKYHHERYDGSGYPNGLAGSKIPEYARIIAIADSYDRMFSTEKLSEADIRLKLEESRGTSFDPIFTDIMMAMIDEGVIFA